MLNLDDLEEESGVKRKNTKERIKEEKALLAKKLAEEAKYNVRKDVFEKEMACEASCRDMVKTLFDKLGYDLKWPLVQASARHVRGAFDTLVDLADRRIRLLEDTIKGRDLRIDLLRTMHFEVVNKLLKRHESNINALTSDYMKAKEKMMGERRTFLQKALVKGKQLRDEIRVAAYASDRGEEIQKLIQRHEGELGTYNEMCLRRFEDFYQDYEKCILDKWIQYKNIFEDYKKESEELRREIFIAKDKDKWEEKEIMRLNQMRSKLEGQMENRKNPLNTGKEKELKGIEEKMEELEGQLKQLQKAEKRASNVNQERLDQLNRVSDVVLKKLKKVRELGERVVRLRRCCNSLETAEERVTAGDLDHKHGDHEATQAISTDFPQAEVLETQTARVEAQNAFMEAKIRLIRKEELYLRKCLREVIRSMADPLEKNQLTRKLYSLQQ